jgi:hypothetical protein
LFAVATGKKAQKQARLDDRATVIQQRMAAERRARNIIIMAFAALLVGGSLLIYFFATYQPPQPKGGTASNTAVYSVPDEGHTHMPDCQPTWKHHPPSSGCHASVGGVAPAEWKAYPLSQAVPPEDFIHNLEHGGVVLVYRCSGSECDSIYQQAFSLFSVLPKEKYHEVKFVATPYQDMSPKFALLGWTEEQDMATLDTNTVKAFYQQFVDHGREDIP